MRVDHFDVVIVGAGFAGMYMLYKIRELRYSALVMESGDDVGGTWYWNRYPGARCDIESLQYSYQFDDDLQQEWEWSERYATQGEILKYARHVADRHDLKRNIRFNTTVTSAIFDAQAGEWSLRDSLGVCTRARFCIMATGCLSAPNWPEIEGLQDFMGPTYHTGLWPKEDIDFSGQRVGIIGTGSSGIQSIPLIAEQAAQLIVFQRTPNYSIPARNALLTPETVRSVKQRYAEFRKEASRTPPGIHAIFNPNSVHDASPDEQFAAFDKRWQEGGLLFMGAFGDLMLTKNGNDVAANFVKDRIREIVKDPEIAEILCPKNIIGGKRLCVDTDYYATYNRENVTLVDIKKNPIQCITQNGIMVAQTVIEIDALVIATGFDAMTGALRAIDIQGLGGTKLCERWVAGPSSYLGLAMYDFPNLFTINGPGSPSVFTNMLPSIEQHVDWIADCLAFMKARNHVRIEVEKKAEIAWWEHVQDVAKIGLKATTESWYIGANIDNKPKVFMPYLGGYPQYCDKCDEIVAEDYKGFLFT